MQTTQIVLASRPKGMPQEENFSLEYTELAPLKPGEVLIRVKFLSLDPYMRGRMSKEKSYAEPLAIGDVILGESVGIIEASRSERFSEGDHVACWTGWRSHFIEHESNQRLHKVDPDKVPLSAYLGVCGMPGRTAYFGLLRHGKPQAGETLVVSAASGAVGSVVGQMGKMHGLRVVGVAGGEEKCAWVKQQLGFDDCIDYKSEDLDSALARCCPDGIDIYFENVGGDLSKAVARQLNPGARVPICGYISRYTATDRNIDTPFDIFGGLEQPPEHTFFLVFDFSDEFDQANEFLTTAVAAGQLRYRETIVPGLENAAKTFRWLFQGKNFGKLLIQVSD